MGKNEVVKKLQNAHLFAWIGDYEEASDIIISIQNSNEKLAAVLRPTLEIKQKEYAEKQMQGNTVELLPEVKFPKAIADKAHDLVISGVRHKRIIPPADTFLRHSKSIESMRWKYSINVASITMGLTRLDIRAFNPNGDFPNLSSFQNIILPGWDTKHGEESSNEDSFNFKWIHCSKPNTETQIYMSIDRWGLLSGTVIVSEEETDAVLGYVHSLLSEIDDLIWK